MFIGERYVIPLNGSFNGNDDLSNIPAGQFSDESRNGNIHNGGFEKRGGTQPVGNQIAASLESLGGGMLVKRSTNTRHIYFAGADGAVYRDGVSILSGRSTTAKTHFVPADDKMFILNGVDAVKVDTGSAVATITSPNADWTGSTHPKKMTIHTKGGSRRAVFWGVAGKETTAYISSTGDFQVATGGTSTTVVVDFRHGSGIIDCVSKDGVLWFLGKEETFYLDDTDADTANWGVVKASFKGGVASPRLTCQAGNFIFAMTTDGDIYEVQTAEQLRDFKEASITRPFFIHNWIRRNVDLTSIAHFHMNDEPKTRSLRIFMRRTGVSYNDVCLVYYYDLQMWAPPHDGRDNSSTNGTGYKAAASFPAEDANMQQRLYTQDYNGRTWEIESTTKTDNGNAYTAVAATGWSDFDLEGVEKRYPYGILAYRSLGDYQVDIQWFIDGAQQSSQTVSLSSSSAVLGGLVLDTDTLALIGTEEVEFELGEVGRKIRMLISNDGAGEDYLLSHLIFPFLNRGVRRK